MEKIKNILGLEIYNGCIMDMFDVDFAKALAWTERRIKKMLGSDEGVSVAEEASLLERKIPGDKEGVYREALLLLAKLRPSYEKYLPKVPKRYKKRKPRNISDLLRKRMRLAIWVGTGNKIPFRELREVLLKNLLKKKGYAFRRNELKWYRGDLCVGTDLFGALEHLESLEAVDRSRLTVSF